MRYFSSYGIASFLLIPLSPEFGSNKSHLPCEYDRVISGQSCSGMSLIVIHREGLALRYTEKDYGETFEYF